MAPVAVPETAAERFVESELVPFEGVAVKEVPKLPLHQYDPPQKYAP